MDINILKKKIDTYRTKKGRITKLNNDLMLEILNAWEVWTGPSASFYKALGADYRKMAKIIGKAKELRRDEIYPEEEFKEISIEGNNIDSGYSNKECLGAEVIWNNNVIRFNNADLLIDFLKKVA